MFNIENKKQFAIILLAVGLGLFAAFLTSQYIKNSITEQTKTFAQSYVQSNMEKEQQLQQQIEMLRAQMAQEIQRVAQEAAQQAAAQQAQQQVVTKTEEKEVRQEAFSVRMPKGKRALTVLIDSLSAVGGLIKAGDLVDIIAHLQIPDKDKADENNVEKKEDVTTILFQKILVLSVNTNFDDMTPPDYVQQQQAGRLNITLALEPEAAALLTFAQKNGQLQFTLRAPDEKETGVFKVASWQALSDFVLEHQGTRLKVPRDKIKTATPVVTTEIEKEPESVIKIFKSGQEVQ